MIKIMTGNERILKEYEKRKVSTLRKHEAEMEALKVRKKGSWRDLKKDTLMSSSKRRAPPRCTKFITK